MGSVMQCGIRGKQAAIDKVSCNQHQPNLLLGLRANSVRDRSLHSFWAVQRLTAQLQAEREGGKSLLAYVKGVGPYLV